MPEQDVAQEAIAPEHALPGMRFVVTDSGYDGARVNVGDMGTLVERYGRRGWYVLMDTSGNEYDYETDSGLHYHWTMSDISISITGELPFILNDAEMPSWMNGITDLNSENLALLNSRFQTWLSFRRSSTYFHDVITQFHSVSPVNCRFCRQWHLEEDTHSIAGYANVCSNCVDRQFRECEFCNQMRRNGDMSSITYQGEYLPACYECIQSQFVYCGHCSEYYLRTDDHDINHLCDCESPIKSFTLKNDGQPILANDTRIEYSMPAGHIDDSGIYEIKRMLRYSDHYENGQALSNWAYVVDELEPVWQARRGNFTRRLSSAIYQASNRQMRIPADLLSRIGEMARNYTSDAHTFYLEFTREFNQSAAAFAHADSCYWQSYQESRCTLKHHGAIGMRAYESMDYAGNANGRAWIMPMKYKDIEAWDGETQRQLRPSFDTMNADAFVVFNGYDYSQNDDGDGWGYVPARIFAHMQGMSYKKIGFSAEPMYINANGYLIAPENILSEVSEIEWNLDAHDTMSYETEVRELRNARIDSISVSPISADNDIAEIADLLQPVSLTNETPANHAARIRQWARTAGIAVNARGRIPREIVLQYLNAQSELSDWERDLLMPTSHEML